MQSKDSSKSRSEHARNETRDSQGRYESTDKKDNKTDSKTKNESRSEHARSEKRDSNGRFTK